MSWSWTCLLSTQRPDCSVEWASQLTPPNVGEVKNALRDENPAAVRALVPSSRTETMPGANGGSLHSGLTVALDEGDDHVLAAQAGQQVGGRDRAVRIGGARAASANCARSRAAVARCCGPQRRRSWSWTETRPVSAERRPSPTAALAIHTTPRAPTTHAEPRRCAALRRATRSDAQAETCDHGDREQHRAGDGEIRPGRADRVTQDADRQGRGCSSR